MTLSPSITGGADPAFQGARSRSVQGTVGRFTLAALVAAATLFPILRILLILASNGVNNLSVDDIMIAPLVAKLLDGNYAWANLFRDTFINGHSQVFPVLAHAVFARFLSWNVFPILYFGVLLNAGCLSLTYGLLTRYCRYSLRWLLLPVLSFLFFAPSKLTVFEFEFPSLQVGLSYLGFIAGLWGLVRYRGAWRGIAWMVSGGWLASWSWASGTLSWPVFFLGLALLGERRPSRYAVWLLGAAIASLPYVVYLLLHPAADLYNLVEVRPKSGSLTFVSWFNAEFFLQALGWPFAQNFSLEVAFRRGCLGLGFLLSGLWILWTKRHSPRFERYVPALLILAFSLMSIWEISLFRSYMAQWYSAPFMFFWVALAGMAYAFSEGRNEFYASRGRGEHPVQGFPFIWSELLLVTLVFLYLTSNLTYADKSFYLQMRAPVSASCLRHYETAPTYCEQSLFLWPPGQFGLQARLARPLESHGLSVFAPRQTWTLQGDFILDQVRLREDPAVPEIYWSADLTAESTPYSDYRPLNLFLHTPNAVDWRVTFPKELRRAEFRSAIAISRSAPHEPVSDGVRFEVGAEPEGEKNEVVFSQEVSPEQREWIPISIDLTRFAGKTVTLHLSSRMGGNYIHDWAMYRYPTLEVESAPASASQLTETEMRPSNTDLSDDLPKTGREDFVLDPEDASLWNKGEIKDYLEKFAWLGDWIAGVDPGMEYGKSLNLCLADYSHLLVKVAASPEIYPRSARILLKLEGSALYQKDLRIPLLPDGEVHQYSYDLKLLKPYRGRRLTGILLNPILPQGKPIRGEVKVLDFRLVRGEGENHCKETGG